MMLTADELTDKEYEEVIAAGVDDYFVKPFPSSKILVHLGKGLKQRNLLLQKRRQEKELGRLKEQAGLPEGGSYEGPEADGAKNETEEATDEGTLSAVTQ